MMKIVLLVSVIAVMTAATAADADLFSNKKAKNSAFLAPPPPARTVTHKQNFLGSKTTYQKQNINPNKGFYRK